MVAKIKIAKGIKQALNYNERKVEKGQADCIFAGNFLKDSGQLNFYDKLRRFEDLQQRNQRAKTNGLHISLNFDPSEKFSKEKLTAIASDYMQKIGFGQQPFVVYQHHDAGHPHIHIVTTNIQTDGSRIPTHNIGRNQSEKARKELEIEYHLLKADQQGKKQREKIRPLDMQRLRYGKSETKRGITNVLDAVLDHYKYTSLTELNAVLRLYNVMADRGNEDSLTFRKKGLVFRILDKDGHKTGVPIKASSIYSKPTLDTLEKKFERNKALRLPDRQRLKSAIDWVIINAPRSMEALKQELKNEGIDMVLSRNKEGLIYGLTFVDHNTKAVFKGSTIGRQYSAKGIMDKCGLVQQMKATGPVIKPSIAASSKRAYYNQIPFKSPAMHWEKEKLTEQIGKALEQLIRPIDDYEELPSELLKEERRKKKKHRLRHL